MPAFGGGTAINTITRNGRTIRYLRITSGPQRDRYVHQLVAEAMLGRPLGLDEEVDHINRDTLDNRWENLQVVDRVTHGKVTRERCRG